MIYFRVAMNKILDKHFKVKNSHFHVFLIWEGSQSQRI